MKIKLVVVRYAIAWPRMMYAQRRSSQILQEERVNAFQRRRGFPARVWRCGDITQKWRNVARPRYISRAKDENLLFVYDGGVWPAVDTLVHG
jgi:hypothetical protein